MKNYRMTALSGWAQSKRRTYSYRGQVITQEYRSHDVRNKTHNGYWWGVQFATGQSIHGLTTRAAAKAAIDRYEEARA